MYLIRTDQSFDLRIPLERYDSSYELKTIQFDVNDKFIRSKYCCHECMCSLSCTEIK